MGEDPFTLEIVETRPIIITSGAIIVTHVLKTMNLPQSHSTVYFLFEIYVPCYYVWILISTTYFMCLLSHFQRLYDPTMFLVLRCGKKYAQ